VRLKRLLLLSVPFFDSALILTLIQPPIGWSFLAWIAVASFALGCSPRFRPRTLALVAWVVGFLYWLVNLYWIAPITVPGWIGLCFYIALLWPLLALALRFCRTRNIPLTLALPILVVGAECLQGFPLGGFYWRLLGHSQYANLTLIQIADVFGAAGVSFVLALVNGFIVDVILAAAATQPKFSESVEPEEDSTSFVSLACEALDSFFAGGKKPSGRSLVWRTILVLAAVCGTIFYGQWRLRQSREYVTEGPVVAALQSNVPQSVKNSFKASDELFRELLAQSEAAAEAGAELIAWPETMVQALLQPELWPHLKSVPDEDKIFHETLCDHARGTAFVLVGAYGGEILTDAQGKNFLGDYNSAFLYRPEGTRDPGRYDKIHLVLFGEYIPFRRSFNWLYQQLRRFTPYAYDYSLEHGTNYTVFAMTTPTRQTDANTIPTVEPTEQPSTHRFGVIICYEDAIPYVARNFALDENDRKRIDWLVNISNDGWFVRFHNGAGKVRPSSELAQHAAICVFRAVENRLPILRSVNTGISCLIDSTGRLRNSYQAGSEGFPAKAMRRTGMAGWFTDRMPIDTRVTFYSRHGQWLDTTCAVAFVAALVAPFVMGVRRRRAEKARRSAKRG
jgi:apolipoprotein N-acyltransferase